MGGAVVGVVVVGAVVVGAVVVGASVVVVSGPADTTMVTVVDFGSARVPAPAVPTRRKNTRRARSTSG